MEAAGDQMSFPAIERLLNVVSKRHKVQLQAARNEREAAQELLEAAKKMVMWSWTLPLADREADVWKPLDEAIAKVESFR
jgi:hypothetical protein